MKVGSHRDMGILLRNVECGEECRRRQETCQNCVVVEAERGGEDILIIDWTSR